MNLASTASSKERTEGTMKEEEGVLPGENKESARTIGTISSGSTDHPGSLFSPNIHWL